MKKSFMTRVLAVSLSAAMAFSMSSASNLMTASAASTVNLKTTFKTLKVNQTYKMTLKNNTLNWKITKVTTSNKKICTVYGKTASSVMLKGKGVGRAKITVKVKTTKRKYPKNIKLMKCTANVKAADTPSTEAFSASATANGNTEVNVTFSQAIDAAEIANFAISDNVQVTEVKLGDDKKTAVLTIAGAEYSKSYDLTVTGIKVAGKEQAEQKLTFTTPASTTEYPVTLETDAELLKANGSTQTVVTFTIKDRNGNPVTDKGIEVAFSASLGTFAEQRVTVENGVATNVYTAPTLMETQDADLRAVVVESTENQKLLNINATKTIKLSPSGEDTSIGAIITSITAPTADRVYAYFNQPVDAADFVKEKTKRLDTSKFEAKVYSGVDNGLMDNLDQDERITKTDIIGVLPVPGEEKALQLLVKEPMTDNSNVVVRFKNKNNANSLIAADNTVSCKLTDARQPSILDVSTNDNSDITVTFSEAMLLRELCNGSVADNTLDEDQFRFAADNPANYRLDGISLNDLDVEILTAGGEDTDDTTGAIKTLSEKNDDPEGRGSGKGSIQGGKYANMDDKRSEVTIKLGVRARDVLRSGNHSLTISNVGDWAAKTDKERNIVNTQTMSFAVQENNELPSFTVEPQSPEQYKVVFNHAFDLVEANDTVKIKNSAASIWNSIIELQQRDGSSWKTISDGDSSGKNPIRVSKVNNEDNTYVVEVRKDWTEVYNTLSTRRNYYNYQLRLHIDAGRITNLANGKVNEELNVELDGDIMRSMDITSPSIDAVEQATDKNDNLLDSYNITLSEPVKMSSDANGETLTPSQTQSQLVSANTTNNFGVPAPSAQFINEDGSKTVDARVTSDAFVDAYDQVINVEPVSTLDPGKWRVVVSSISDDYGNTAPTAVHEVEVTGETTTTDFKIVWAAVGENETYNEAEMGTSSHRYGRYIYVKFSKPINLVGNSANALTTGNYSVDGATLPTGTNIHAKIKGYDDDIKGITDSITIELPERRYNSASEYTVDAWNTILNVSKAITSQTGETLSGETHIRLPYNFGDANKIESLRTTTDAVWGNDPSEQSASTLKEYYQKLKDALANDKYRKVILTRPLDLVSSDSVAREVFGRNNTLTINRAVDLELEANITGNVLISTSDVVNHMVISAPNGNYSITGYNASANNEAATLTVDAVNAGVLTDGVEINKGTNNKYAISINDVYSNTFVNAGTVDGDVNITDSNGAGFSSPGEIQGMLYLSTDGRVNLKGVLNVRDGIQVRGVAIVDLKDANLSNNLAISVYASNARIIMGTETVIAADVKIIAEASDVRITVPQDLANKIKFLTGANGSFKAVTEGNREVTDSTNSAAAPVSSFYNAQENKTALADKLDKLNVFTGTLEEAAVDKTMTVSRSAISGSAINAGTLESQIKAALGADSATDSDGLTYQVSVAYSLVVSRGLKQDGNVVSITNVNAETKDEIRVTIKITKGNETTEVVRWIYAEKG